MSGRLVPSPGFILFLSEWPGQCINGGSTQSWRHSRVDERPFWDTLFGRAGRMVIGWPLIPYCCSSVPLLCAAKVVRLRRSRALHKRLPMDLWTRRNSRTIYFRSNVNLFNMFLNNTFMAKWAAFRHGCPPQKDLKSSQTHRKQNTQFKKQIKKKCFKTNL